MQRVEIPEPMLRMAHKALRIKRPFDLACKSKALRICMQAYAETKLRKTQQHNPTNPQQPLNFA